MITLIIIFSFFYISCGDVTTESTTKTNTEVTPINLVEERKEVETTSLNTDKSVKNISIEKNDVSPKYFKHIQNRKKQNIDESENDVINVNKSKQAKQELHINKTTVSRKSSNKEKNKKRRKASVSPSPVINKKIYSYTLPSRPKTHNKKNKSEEIESNIGWKKKDIQKLKNTAEGWRKDRIQFLTDLEELSYLQHKRLLIKYKLENSNKKTVYYHSGVFVKNQRIKEGIIIMGKLALLTYNLDDLAIYKTLLIFDWLFYLNRISANFSGNIESNFEEVVNMKKKEMELLQKNILISRKEYASEDEKLIKKLEKKLRAKKIPGKLKFNKEVGIIINNIEKEGGYYDLYLTENKGNKSLYKNMALTSYILLKYFYFWSIKTKNLTGNNKKIIKEKYEKLYDNNGELKK